MGEVTGGNTDPPAAAPPPLPGKEAVEEAVSGEVHMGENTLVVVWRLVVVVVVVVVVAV